MKENYLLKQPLFVCAITAFTLVTGCAAETPMMMVDDDPTSIEEDTTWAAADQHILKQNKHYIVKDGATLTIEAGTTIFGELGSALIVARGGRLVAKGTAQAPIVFTSANLTQNSGDWAGVALLGKATVNKGSDAGGYFEGNLEGIDPSLPESLYGGTDDAWNCGMLEYVRIEYAGAEFSPDNELNGLTLAGCGTGTTVHHLQVHRAKDDGIEFFGGTAGMDHVVITGADDDSLDWDHGWRGSVNNLIIHQYAGLGDNGIEADNEGSNQDATPRSNPTLTNVTMIGGGEGNRGMVLREGTGATIMQFIVTGFKKGPLDIRDTSTTALWGTDLSISESYFYGNGSFPDETGENDNDGGFDEKAMLMESATKNHFLGDAMLPTTEGDYKPAGTVTTTSGFAGAVDPDASENWLSGWTAFPPAGNTAQ